MDGFAFHPYEDNSSVAPLSGTHPSTSTIALADYEKLVAALGGAFPDGYSLPIWYDEFGVESQIPAEKLPLYAGAEPATTKPVPEATQAAYYRSGAARASRTCGFLFHSVDETELAAWQSGVYYADGTPKSSIAAVKLALDESRRGVVAHCDDLELEVQAVVAQRGPMLTLTCDIDCSYVAELYRLPGRLLVTKHGRAIGGKATTLPLRVPKPNAKYRLRLSAVAPVNPGRPRCGSCRAARVASGRGGPVRRVHLLPRRAGVAAAADRGPPGQGMPFRSRRGLHGPLPSPARLHDHGVRPDTDFFLWKITDRYEALASSGQR
jgi:hypothetical protein